MDKVLIENASLELLELFEQVSEEAKKEKLAIPPINKMIYWWTRKPLVVGRTIVLASTLRNIDDVKSLLGDLNRKSRTYRHIPDVKKFTQKLGMDPKQIKILDPFGGQGNLVFPAAQLGLDVTISDYNPLAYLIERSVLEFPAKYGLDLARDFEKYAKQVIEKTKAECGKFFKENQLTYLWCWCIKCPHCGQRVPLANQMYIVNTPKKKIGIKFIPKNKDFTVEIIQNISETEGKKFTQKGGSAKCISCTNIIDYDSMTADISKRKDREMIVIQVQKQRTRDYVVPTSEDKKLHHESIKYFESQKHEFEKNDLIPNDDVRKSRGESLENYGMETWAKFFDERQLLVLATFLKNVKTVCNQIKDVEYRSVIAFYLSAFLCKRVDMSSFGVPWIASVEAPRPTLTFRRPSIVFNFGESNPFEQIAGGLTNILKGVVNGIKFATQIQNVSKCNLTSVTIPSNDKFDLIITDPPYGDDVQYGEQSDFFYVWASRILKNYFVMLPNRIPLDEDFCESWNRFTSKKIASEFFAKGLKKSFVAMSEKLKDDGLMVVFFANSSTKAWNLLLESIRAAKLEIISSYAIHTEKTSNVIAKGKTSFMSSIVISCRKINKESIEYFEDIITKTEDKIKEMLAQIPNEKLLTLPITDLLIMVYGKVLEACTKHTKLITHEKREISADFETLISDIRSFIMKELVIKLTGTTMNVIGKIMAFYLITKVFHRGIISGDEAIKIAQIYGIDIAKLEKDQIILNEKGILRLSYLTENLIEKKPDQVESSDLYEQLCYLAQLVDSNNSDKIPKLLATNSFKQEDLKKVISLLVKSYHLRKNKGESLNTKELSEMKTLETLADTLGIKTDGTLDTFIDK